jgi:cell wall-associated NlpC family hydrolase
LKNIGKYIGIKHEYGESTWEHCDCAGLCTLFYRENFDYIIDDGKPMGTAETSKSHPLRMSRWLLKNMDKVKEYNNLQWGDIVLFRISNEHHVGIALEYGKVLAMEVPCVYGHTKSTIYRKSFVEPYFIMGFRRR